MDSSIGNTPPEFDDKKLIVLVPSKTAQGIYR